MYEIFENNKTYIGNLGKYNENQIDGSVDIIIQCDTFSFSDYVDYVSYKYI